MPEIVCILENPFMPDLVKIGKTKKSVEERMNDLYSTKGSGVPAPFECYYACEVENSDEVEKAFHYGFGAHRVNQNREFFRVEPRRVKAILELLAIKDVTPEGDVVEDTADQRALDNARAKRPNFQFSVVGIEAGSELKFLKDETIICKVADDKDNRKVEFEGEELFLNKATLDILKKQFDEEPRSVRGPDFWLYEDETLTERRLRMETSDG